MSAIPPHPIASILQSPTAQTDQARHTDADKNAQVDRARQTAAGGFADVLEVEETDADTKVHTDSGGAGGQGRQDAPPEEEQQSDSETGVIVDEHGRPHLDLSA